MWIATDKTQDFCNSNSNACSTSKQNSWQIFFSLLTVPPQGQTQGLSYKDQDQDLGGKDQDKDKD